MFQSFQVASSLKSAEPRLAALRAQMAARRVDAFLVPRADEHQGEYVPPCAERLKWLTGFSGSAGLAIVTAKAAAVLVDGRYTVQSRAEVETRLFEILQVPAAKPAEWLSAKLTSGQTVGYDPRLHTVSEIGRLKDALAARAIKLKPVPRNLVDAAWGSERPAPPLAPVRVQPLELSGRGAGEKLAEIRDLLKKDQQAAVILTLPDSIAWLFNIRGADVAHNPVPLSFAIVHVDAKPELFIAQGKLDKPTRSYLSALARLTDPAALGERLKVLRDKGRKVRLDADRSAIWFAQTLGARNVIQGGDPCILPKARKNAAEIAGARAAHLRDGGAMVRFLAWLDAAAAGGKLDEIAAVRKLEELRRATGQLEEISFDTISGSGPNGAIVHYRVSEATNRVLGSGELFLIDSGGQYRDGTTDITRTVAIGSPSAEMRERYTLVLKGHLAIAAARFPKGTRGIDIDGFARRALWEHGLDYDHGTGHGVGSFLSVHEGPQSISRAGMVPLEPGMILSNEPGYYKEGAYGIRIENLVLVTPSARVKGGDRDMMSFETLTLAPYDRRLIDTRLLTDAETLQVDAYHARVRDALSAELDPASRSWLEAATRPL